MGRVKGVPNKPRQTVQQAAAMISSVIDVMDPAKRKERALADMVAAAQAFWEAARELHKVSDDPLGEMVATLDRWSVAEHGLRVSEYMPRLSEISRVEISHKAVKRMIEVVCVDVLKTEG